MLRADLIDKAEDTNISRRDSYSRKDALEKALPESYEVEAEKTGGYQGDIYLVVKGDGKVWLYNDSYGSCSGCDSYLADPASWLDRALRSSIGFNDKFSAINYIIGDSKGYDWKRGNTLELIKLIVKEEEDDE